MNYYPAWFDYAAALFGGAGVICVFVSKAEQASRKRGFVRLGACLLGAFGIGFAATGGVLFNLRAPHLSARGDIFDVVRHQGKSSSTRFGLRVPSGEIDSLNLSSAIKQIADGETAEVEYQAGSYDVLDIRIVEGRYSGYEATGADGMTGAGFSLFGALVLAIVGVVSWLGDRMATPSGPNQRAADGDVDRNSMLNLSSLD